MRRNRTCFFVVMVWLTFLTINDPAADPSYFPTSTGTLDDGYKSALAVEYAADNALYFVGDTANPRCSTFIPMRLNILTDTNYWYQGALWAERGDWGNNDPWDSIRITDACGDESQWLAVKDKSIMMHYSCLPIPDGFPSGDPQSNTILCTGTPLSVVGSACEEGIHLFATKDLWNVSNQLGPSASDTIANPLFVPADLIIDTIFWHLQPGQDGLDSFYTFSDTGRYVPESVLVPEYDGADTVHTWIHSAYTADPRLVQGPDDSLYIFFLAAFTRAWYHGGHYNSIKAGSVYVAKSSNGYIWKDLTRIVHLNTALVSPAPIVNSDGSASMWMASVSNQEAAYQSGQVYKFSSDQILPDTGFWPPATPCTHDFKGYYDSCDGERIWHIGVKAAGETERLLVFNTTAINCNQSVGICTSSDRGDTWSCQTDPLLGVVPKRWDSDQLYAPELMAWDGAASGWLLFYSGFGKSTGQWHAAFTPLLEAGSLVRMPGDANHDGFVNVGDVVFIVNYVFKGGAGPNPLAAADVNGDCQVNIGDAVYLIGYIFRSGAPPQPGCAE